MKCTLTENLKQLKHQNLQMKILVLFLCLLFIPFASKSQMRPSAAQPNIENKILIDSLMKVTRYKEYFQSYCDRQIDNVAKLKNWDEDKIRQKKLSVSFNEFK